MSQAVTHIYGAQCCIDAPVSAERQQLIDDLERLIGDIKTGAVTIHANRMMLCYEEIRDGGRYPVGFRVSGLSFAYTLMEATGLLRWIAQTIQEKG